ncbi:hypothetical protein TRAPUB_12281 [Trametes pubescens]|uniref:Uncharacterized protein n=1 Tax=Trametes pubescens TaxID=154538 RepID=A0A1M2VUB7_TRAPU|nr:hypothetical protein TRAPUB_12281 [Trametes pubescens]
MIGSWQGPRRYAAGEEWPPRDPQAYVRPEADPNYKFQLPESPWTYENGTLNPGLQPSTTRRRRSAPTHSSVPPYHPDYDGDAGGSYPVSESEDEYEEDTVGQPREFVRRGSEGYEVRPIDREGMLRSYIEDRTAEPGRYHLYVPDPPSDPDSGTEAEDEKVPLSKKLEMWQTEVA